MSLRRKLAVLVLVTLVPLAAVIVYNLVHLYQDLQDGAVEEASTRARISSVALERLVHELAEEGVAAGLAVTEGGMGRDDAEEYLARLGRHVTFSDVMVVDASGRTLAAAAPGTPEDVSDLPAFRQVAGGRDFAVQLFERQGEPAFIVFSRLERLGRMTGASGVVVDEASLAAILPDAEPGAVLLVTDGEGVVAYASDRRIAVGRDLKGFAPVSVALRGRDYRSESVWLPGAGGRHVGAQIPVEEVGWTAGYYLPSGEALEHVTDEVVLTVGVIGLILVLTQAAARAWALSIVRPVAQLAEATGEVAHGRFDAPLEVTSNDEIGDLADHFRDMQRSLARTFRDVTLLDEASRRTNASLETDEVVTVAFEYMDRILEPAAVVVTLSTEGGWGRPQVIGHGLDQDEARRLSREAEEVAGYLDLDTRGYAVADIGKIRLPSAGLLPDSPELLLLLPLVVRGREIGRVDVYTSRRSAQEDFERTDVPLVLSFTQQFAVALANARLYKLQHDIAETLQDSLLTKPYRMAGVDFGLAYRPATVGARIGGDYYDFIPVDDHRMVVVIGDISGKGISAARHTATAKAAIRLFTLEDASSPAAVLARANRTIAEQTEAETFITALYVLLDSSTGEVVYVNAGHPSPVLLHAGGEAEFLGGHDAPLGVLPDSVFEAHSVRLSPGERLVTYTDGLSEARRDGELFGEDRVRDIVWALREEPIESMASCIADRATAFAGGRLQDDLAVVVIARTGETAPV